MPRNANSANDESDDESDDIFKVYISSGAWRFVFFEAMLTHL